MASVTTVESLILKATNPLTKDEDPNVIQSVCQAVSTEDGGIKTALRLIVHKMHSPQEKEALQALLILQSCVNNCGSAFHAEIGKFRFLNEMIKLVSPKYLGEHSSPCIKRKVIELLYTWTVDLTNESKIIEAYQMLKDQNIVKDDPKYIGMPSKTPLKPKTSVSFEDEEKSRVLQRLLQSKRPEDVLKANAIIKHMVKEDERRMERSTRRSIQVETALNNVSVLDEMLSQFERTYSGSQSDLDVMAELNTSCMSLQTNIYRLVSEIDDKEEGIGDILKANDELSRVMGRYKLLMEEKKMQEKSSDDSNKVLHKREEDTLLDLSSPQKEGNSISQEPSALEDLGLGSLNLHQGLTTPASESSKLSKESSLLDQLENTLLITSDLSAKGSLQMSPGSDDLVVSSGSSLLLPEKPKLPSKTEHTSPQERPKPLEDLDILGSSLLKQSLPPNVNPLGLQFKPQEKVSLNQLRSQPNPSQPTVKSAVPIKDAPLASLAESLLGDHSSMAAATNLSNSSEVSQSLLNSDLSILLNPSNTISSVSTTSLSNPAQLSNDLNGVLNEASLASDSALLDVSSGSGTGLAESSQPLDNSVIDSPLASTEDPKVPPAAGSKLLSHMQLSEVKSLGEVSVSLESIKPGKQSSIKLLESNSVSLTLHFAENKPREDVSVIVISVTSQNPKPVSNYVLQAVVPKGCKVRLQSPSANSLQGFTPFLPPPAITQIMLIANPNQLNVSLKAMLSYSMDDDLVTDMGEIESLPL